MRKADEIRNPLSCFSKATPETLLFVLLDWDEATPETIRFWCISRLKRGLNKQSDDQIVEAQALANEIEKNLPAIRAARRPTAPKPNPQAAWPFPK